jgi:hypothetical protein
MIKSKLLVEEIFDAIMLEESEPNYDVLIRWSERYPEYREELSKFFATWAVQAELQEEIVVDEERLASLAVSHALDILHRQNSPPTRTSKISGTRPSLIAAARTIGFSEEELATRVQLDVTMIEKLDLRRLTSIPRFCFDRIASVLGLVADRVEEMTTGPPLFPANVRYKARQKPTVTTEDFVYAISNSSLSDEIKQLWLEAVEAELRKAKE